MRMQARQGKSCPRHAAPRSGCGRVPDQIRMLDCCSHVPFDLFLQPIAMHMITFASLFYGLLAQQQACTAQLQPCTQFSEQKCMREVTEHLRTSALGWSVIRSHAWVMHEFRSQFVARLMLEGDMHARRRLIAIETNFDWQIWKFFLVVEILWDLNQAAPDHFTGESQTRHPITSPDHPQRSMADDTPSPVQLRSPTGPRLPIGNGEYVQQYVT